MPNFPFKIGQEVLYNGFHERYNDMIATIIQILPSGNCVIEIHTDDTFVRIVSIPGSLSLLELTPEEKELQQRTEYAMKYL
jgi:hypothetical protein